MQYSKSDLYGFKLREQHVWTRKIYIKDKMLHIIAFVVCDQSFNQFQGHLVVFSTENL